MKNFLEEVFKYFWIPLIMALVSYIFFQMHDALLGIVTLVALSAIYTLVRFYLLHKKWWLLIILMVVAFAGVGFFFLRSPDITLSINGQEVKVTTISMSSGSVSVSPGPGTIGVYVKNTQVTLNATPAPGYDWKSWTGTEDDTSNPTIVNMNRNKQITVNFVPRFSLIINNQLVIGSFVGFDEGSVSITPAPDSDGKYTSGTVVTLTARSNPGYDWTDWIGTSKDASNPATVTMSEGNKNITVTFKPRFSLTVGNQMVIGSVINFSEGAVSVDPAPDDDGKYAYGTKVFLTAVPIPGYGWKNWIGTGNDISNPAAVTITNDRHVMVTFEQRFLLSVNSQPVIGPESNTTGGEITINPAPGTDGRYARDTIAILTAIPAEGYRFDRWSGDASGNTTFVSVSMNGPRNVNAAFVKVSTLTASVTPAEGGTISPANGTFDTGTSVKLTALPASGYRFDRWSGDASGNATSFTIVMNTDKTITATFIKVYTLTASVDPAEGGSISPVKDSYDADTKVILTAVPASGYHFDHWSGDASGNDTSVTITMDADKSITAVFIKD